ncbi:MAG: DUF3284 domain-containing protein [Atopobiaceae bacterium]|jgi:hypothetical protein|nr:DUF3284 domain-containing protein [Atopobiaceae bacterium]MCH4181522.1 DUF3284 domain-containing protein [Atopobiaceae bacterium]MCH4214661.1 DUF3284 domain-containing protein [Atopobiaceae bacterium]MCI1225892.1 DUF3284 domain-containing protein [Atopobiaceae bacterium]MCI1260469.1 DUF3284 domain-containing protein [Atopobiaceae bacterium]
MSGHGHKGIVVIEHLDVSAEQFFSAVARSVAYAAHSAGIPATSSDVRTGFSYQTSLRDKLGHDQRTSVEVTRFEPPAAYAARIVSGQGTNTVAYEVTPADGGGIEVAYEEGFVGSTTCNDLNYKLVGLAWRHSAKKRMRRVLHGIEACAGEVASHGMDALAAAED